MYRLCLLLLPLLAASSVWAENNSIKIREVVISATKIAEPVEETTSSVTIIPQKTIESKGAEFVVDLLKDLPELNLVQNGGPGKLAEVYLRGGHPKHLLVMIDGVKVKSTTSGTFDFSGISTDDIERIEIVKGPQSTIYGSEAMSGVINIITKKGSDKIHADLILEGGSFGTHKASASVSGSSKMLDYRVTTSYLKTDGISTATEGDEKDGYENASFSTKLGINPSDIFNLEFTGRYSYDRTELDDYSYLQRALVDALNYVQHGHHYILSGKANLYLFDIWEQVLTASKAKDTARYRDADTSWNNFDLITSIDTVDWQHNLYLFDDNYIFTAGAEYREEKGENKGLFDRTTDNRAFYLNNQIKLLEKNLNLNVGLRLDDNESFGGHDTYRIGAVYNFKTIGLRARASYGTGFRAPSFNELFYPNYGNPDLEPEESKAWEAGLEKDLLEDRLLLSLTYFDQSYENLIQTDPLTWTAANIAEAKVQGIEMGAAIKVSESITVKSSYTYLDTEDKDTGERLTRRPKDKIAITSEYSKGPVALLLSYTFTGKVYDSSANSHLGSYSLVNLGGSYKVRKSIKLFARIDNLLDEDYESAGGYNTPGFSAFAGIKLEI